MTDWYLDCNFVINRWWKNWSKRWGKNWGQRFWIYILSFFPIYILFPKLLV